MPEAVTAYKAMDGTLHDSMVQAVAADLMKVCNSASGRADALTPAGAWAIIECRKYVIETLLSLESADES